MSVDLREAVWHGDVKTLRHLVEVGADPDAVDESTGWTGLMFAAENLQVETLVVLLQLGADPPFSMPDGWTALHHAVDSECDADNQTGLVAEGRMVRLLIAAGADPDAQWRTGSEPPRSPREMAARYNCPTVEAAFT